jgi:hypothetical protein
VFADVTEAGLRERIETLLDARVLAGGGGA